MSRLLAQIVLAGRNEDVESWMNILFIVVLAAFWVLGGILKAKSKNAQSRKDGQAPPKPVRGPRVPGRASQDLPLKEPDRRAAASRYRPARAGAEQVRTKLAEWRAAAQKFAAEAEQAFRVQTAEPATQPEKPVLRPKRPSQPPASSQPAGKPVRGPVDKETQPPETQSLPPEYLPQLLADYADPDELRRAILHYEILGRPLSLREPDDSPIGL